MAAHPSVCFFLTFAPLWLIGFWSFRVLIFAFQAAVRGSPDSESGFVTGQIVNQVDQTNGRRVASPPNVAQNDMNWAEMVNVRRIDNLKVSQNLQLFVNSDDIDTAPNSIVIMVWDGGPFRRSFSHERMGCVTVWIIIAPSRCDFHVECAASHGTARPMLN
jgi:hypothetical protein